MIVAIVSDLMFRSKIKESSVRSVLFVKSVEALERELANPDDKDIYVDLHVKGIDPIGAISDCAKNASVRSIIAFGSHVEQDLLKKAALSGATRVMPRSEFTVWLQTIRQQKGAGALTMIVFGAMVFSALYYFYHVLPFYYDLYELENQMQASIRLAVNEKDDFIRQKIQRTIKELRVPVDPAKLIIRRENNHMEISLSYREVFYITFRDKDYVLQTFDFTARGEGNF